MKADRVDRIDIGIILPVTFEGKALVLIHGLAIVLYSHATLDAPDSKASHVGEAGDAPRLKFERRFLANMLPRIRGDIVHEQMSSGGGNRHDVTPNVQIVAFPGQIHRSGGSGTSRIPEVEFIIPPPGDDDVRGGDEGDRFDGLCVGPNLLRWGVVRRLLSEFPHPNGLVRSGSKYGRSVGCEAGREDRGIVFVVYLGLGLGLDLAVLFLDFPASHAAVPVRGD
mmetsp:Transcript_22079/g.32255  ORF Transcript_22079/g.32255 Transcript_22079/m.32255 type:complete len:224 (+) Transcript_22079:447-1118(+)